MTAQRSSAPWERSRRNDARCRATIWIPATGRYPVTGFLDWNHVQCMCSSGLRSE